MNAVSRDELVGAIDYAMTERGMSAAELGRLVECSETNMQAFIRRLREGRTNKPRASWLPKLVAELRRRGCFRPETQNAPEPMPERAMTTPVQRSLLDFEHLAERVEEAIHVLTDSKFSPATAQFVAVQLLQDTMKKLK